MPELRTGNAGPTVEATATTAYYHTQASHAKLREKAVPLCTKVCQDAIAASGLQIEDIGKIVVVSSTGFLGPSLDCELIKSLGLWRGVDRSLIGFMGCAVGLASRPCRLGPLRAYLCVR